MIRRTKLKIYYLTKGTKEVLYANTIYFGNEIVIKGTQTIGNDL